jgi:hypothetical protein
MINEVGVVSPDEEKWDPIILGTDLDSLQKRSLYRTLRWSKTVVDRCDLDWWAHDNTVLTSLVCRPPDLLDHWERYTDAVCQSVTMKHAHGLGEQIVATFVVKVD